VLYLSNNKVRRAAVWGASQGPVEGNGCVRTPLRRAHLGGAHSQQQTRPRSPPRAAQIKEWVELERLAGLAKLEDLLLVGNPLYNEHRDANTLPEYRVEVLKRLPGLKKLDGQPVDVDERDQAAAARAGGGGAGAGAA
jgi:hypothetical protein